MTNLDKFREVFGFKPEKNTRRYVCPQGLDCGNTECSKCPFNRKWWEREYKECFELKENKKYTIKWGGKK